MTSTVRSRKESNIVRFISHREEIRKKGVIPEKKSTLPTIYSPSELRGMQKSTMEIITNASTLEHLIKPMIRTKVKKTRRTNKSKRLEANYSDLKSMVHQNHKMFK